MEGAPRDIQRFETAQLVLIFVGLLSSFTANQPQADAVGDAFGMGVLVGTVVALGVVIVGLTLLVTRKRQNWARWVLLAFFVGGVLLHVWSWVILAPRHPLMDFASLVLRGAILALAFTPQSTEWLRTSTRHA